MPMYSEKVMDHFMNPRNVGEIKDADGIGEEGNPVCGDMMTFYIKVKDNRLEDVKFQTFGCGAACYCCFQHGERNGQGEDAGGGSGDNP